jgi:hypothetical protein
MRQCKLASVYHPCRGLRTISAWLAYERLLLGMTPIRPFPMTPIRPFPMTPIRPFPCLHSPLSLPPFAPFLARIRPLQIVLTILAAGGLNSGVQVTSSIRAPFASPNSSSPKGPSL